MSNQVKKPTAIAKTVVFTVFAVSVVALVLFDQWTKAYMRDALAEGARTFIPGVIDFNLVFNNGAAFGMFSDATGIFVAMALLMTAGVIAYFIFIREVYALELVSLSLIVAGAIGNVIDRVFADGLVTDFIATVFIDFPVFNVADICITCGCALFVISMFLPSRMHADEREEKASNNHSLEEDVQEKE